MNPLDLLRKPLNLDTKLFQSTPLSTTTKSLLPALKPPTILQKISAPVPLSVKALAQKAHTTENPTMSVIPKTPLQKISQPLPSTVVKTVFKLAKAFPGQVKTLFNKDESALEKGLNIGLLGVSSNIKRFNEVFYETFGADKTAAKMRMSADSDKELSQYLASEGLEVNDTRKLSEKLQDPEWFYKTLGQSAPSVLASIGVAVPAAILGAPISVGAGAVTAGSIVFGSAYDEAIKEGVAPDKAKGIASLTAIGSGLLEAIPAFRVVSKILAQPVKNELKVSFGRNIVRKIASILKQGSLEGGTESLQQIYENAWKKTYKENQSLFEGVAESGIFGGILGGGVDVAVQTVEGGKEIAEATKDFPNKEGGFIKLPGGEKKPEVEFVEMGTMRDFTDYVNGSYKPTGKDLQDLTEAAQDIADRHGFKAALKGDKALSAEFGEYLDSVSFEETLPQETFEGFTDISTNVLNKLEGRSSVSKQFISDLTNSPDLKQAERDIIRRLLEGEGKTVNVVEFANKVKMELLPLKRLSNTQPQYESISLGEDLRGPVVNYGEHIYSSPIKTSAGDVHFRRQENTGGYFAHTRIEDLPQKNRVSTEPKYNQGDTRRVIEIQSDLFQKGRLEDERMNIAAKVVNADPQFLEKYFQKGRIIPSYGRGQDKVVDFRRNKTGWEVDVEGIGLHDNGVRTHATFPDKKVATDFVYDARETLFRDVFAKEEADFTKLEPYRNTWHERVIREEIKKAAKDGKTKLQFPTGETAMKIEGLGEDAGANWEHDVSDGVRGFLNPNELKVGKTILNNNTDDVWVITDVLGNGKFKAVPKKSYDEYLKLSEPGGVDRLNESASALGQNNNFYTIERLRDEYLNRAETFDISGKIDTNNPIFRFYEKEVGRYLKNKYDAKLVTDAQGVKWWEVAVPKDAAKKPIQAFKKAKASEDLETSARKAGAPFNVPVGEAKKMASRFFNEKEIDFLFPKELIDVNGQKAWGLFTPASIMKNPLIQVVQSNGKIQSSVFYHEVFHAYLKEFTPAKERLILLRNVRNNILAKPKQALYGKDYPDAESRAEEYASDDFARFVARMNHIQENASIYQKILDKIQGWIRKVTGLQNVYEKILNKDRGYQRSLTRKMTFESKFKKARGEIKISQKEIEEANTELNRVFEQQSLAQKIETLTGLHSSLKEERKLLKQVMDESPAKELVKYVSKSTGRLPEVTGKETMKSLTGSGEEVANSEFGVRGDDIVQNDLGFKGLDEAEKSLDDYMDLRESLAKLNKNISKVKNELDVFKSFETVIKSDPSLKMEYETTLRQMRLTQKQIEKNLASRPSRGDTASNQAISDENQTYGESIATKPSDVKPPEGRGGITPPKLNFLNWKDKTALALNRETLERNIASVAGEEAPAVNQFLVTPTRKNETARIEFVNNIRREIRNKVTKNFGIRARSKEAKLVQQYGEKQFGNLDAENLDHLQRLRPNDWSRIKETSDLLRNKYDILLDMVNAERSKFGYKPIPKRVDYFRHFQAIDSAIRQFGLLLREQDLPTEIAGITGIFNPNKPFSTAELKRRGELGATEDAIRGMDNYLDSISKQIFHIDSVTRGRVLEKYIRESAKVGAETGLESEEVRLPNFVSNLHDYTNIIAGKKSALDRALESTFGRRVYALSNWFKRRLGANMIVGNLSSAITNFIPFTQSLATTEKVHAVHGLGEALMSPWKVEYPMIDGVRSDFLLRRFPETAIDFKGFDKGAEMAMWLFSTVDRFTAKSIVSGKYYENRAKGMSKQEAIEAADTYAGKTLADRSLGQTPNIFSSQSLGLITQFQTEVNNAFSFMTKDIPNMSNKKKARIFAALLQFFIYSWLFNEGYQRVMGRRPTIDPIYAAMTLFGLNEENEDVAFTKRLANTVEDIGGNLPFIGGITGGRFPIASALPDPIGLMTGKTTPLAELKKLATFAPPFGGSQAKKTIEGIMTVAKGEERTPSGKNVRYRIDQTPANFIRAGAFGKSSLPEVKEYYKGIDEKAAPRKNKPSNSKKNSNLSGIKLKLKEGLKIDLKNAKSNLSGIKLVPKKKINIKP